EDVDLVVVAARDPQLLPIRGDVAHVRAAAARDLPGGDHLLFGRAEDTHRARSVLSTGDRRPAAVGDVQQRAVAAGIDAVRSGTRLDEPDVLELDGVD